MFVVVNETCDTALGPFQSGQTAERWQKFLNGLDTYRWEVSLLIAPPSDEVEKNQVVPVPK